MAVIVAGPLEDWIRVGASRPRPCSDVPAIDPWAALSLALGIGAATAIFSLTNSLLLRKLPVRDPSALVLVTDATVPGVRAYSVGVWESFRRFADVFDGALAWSSTDFNLVPRGEARIVSGAWVSGSYFETLGISPLLGRMLAESDDRRNGTPIVAGREFVDADRAGTTPVVVVNEAFVGKFLNSSNPLGQVVRIGIVGPNAGSAEVVGVAGAAVYSSLRERAPPTVYFPLAQLHSVPPASLTLTVRSETAAPLQMAGSISAAIGTVDRDAALTFRPLTEQINASLAQERILALLSGFFGGFAVLLAGLGLFGITAYSVSRRRLEIGIRMALGADPGSVIRLVLGRVCLMIAAGVVIGAAASMWTTQFTTSLLFGLEPRDPVTLALAVVILSGAGLLAALPPAWHASHVDPSVALRSE